MIRLLLLAFLCNCASNTTIRVPKEKGNNLIFVGNATAVVSIEDGKRIALNDVIHQALFYVGVDVSSSLYSDRVNQYGVTSEQISLLSSAIVKSARIKKIKTMNKRRVYAEGYGIFDAYDVLLYVGINMSEVKRLKKIASEIQTDTVVRQYSTTQGYSIPRSPVYKQIEKNKAMLLYNDEDKYSNTVVSLPTGFRLKSAVFSLFFPGLGQYVNGEESKAEEHVSAGIVCLYFGYAGLPYCYALGGGVWAISMLDAYIHAEKKYNTIKRRQ